MRSACQFTVMMRLRIPGMTSKDNDPSKRAHVNACTPSNSQAPAPDGREERIDDHQARGS